MARLPKARVLPFERPGAAVGHHRASKTPAPRPAGVGATLSIDAKEVARLVARDLADEWGVQGRWCADSR